jgi:hypothetical protein
MKLFFYLNLISGKFIAQELRRSMSKWQLSDSNVLARVCVHHLFGPNCPVRRCLQLLSKLLANQPKYNSHVNEFLCFLID